MNTKLDNTNDYSKYNRKEISCSHPPNKIVVYNDPNWNKNGPNKRTLISQKKRKDNNHSMKWNNVLQMSYFQYY